MKIKKITGIAILMIFPLFFAACSKEETNMIDEANTSSQRAIGWSEVPPTPIQYRDLSGRNGIVDYYQIWKSIPNSGNDYYTKVINTWDEFYNTFNTNSDYFSYFIQDIDLYQYTLIATLIRCPNQNPEITKELVSYNPNYEYEFRFNVKYGNTVSPATDNRSFLILVPKTGVNVKTTVTYGNQSGFPGQLQPIILP